MTTGTVLRAALRVVAWVLAGATIGCHIVWVLTSGGVRDALTIAGVVAFFLASLTHSLLRQGPRWTVVAFAITLMFGWSVEAVGTATSLPFGDYQYADRLGPAIGPVPAVIPLAWAMMAYPCYVLSRAAVRGWAAPLLAAALLASWDLFLDPQMVSEGHWRWFSPSPALPGIAGIPATNFLGWAVAALVLMTLLSLLPAPSAPTESLAQPTVLLSWVYLSSVLANAAFFGRPSVALVGGLVMGVPMTLLVRARRASAMRRPADAPEQATYA